MAGRALRPCGNHALGQKPRSAARRGGLAALHMGVMNAPVRNTSPGASRLISLPSCGRLAVVRVIFSEDLYAPGCLQLAHLGQSGKCSITRSLTKAARESPLLAPLPSIYYLCELHRTGLEKSRVRGRVKSGNPFSFARSHKEIHNWQEC